MVEENSPHFIGQKAMLHYNTGMSWEEADKQVRANLGMPPLEEGVAYLYALLDQILALKPSIDKVRKMLRPYNN